MQHPHRDAYWKHGSICEDFGGIEAACLCVGGWNDAYSNAVPRLMRGLRSPCKAIIGPWVHKYPHFAVPEPRIGFLQEALRWWDFWLKGEPSGVTRDPAFRVYIMDAQKPGEGQEYWPGRWIGDEIWGAGNTQSKEWYLNADGIGGTPGEEKALTVFSPQSVGKAGGKYCIMWLGDGFPGDQREDDAGSLTFDSPELAQDMDIVGQPVVELELSADKPVAFIALRLNDVWPSGEVSRITYGLKNLCQRDSNEYPGPLDPGRRYRIKIALDDIAWKIPKGHKLRVSLSPSYWPMMWPAPEPVTLTVYAGKSSVHVPVRKTIAGEVPLGWKPAEGAEEARRKELIAPETYRKNSVDPETGETRHEVFEDFGKYEIEPHGLIAQGIRREHYSIMPDDPLSAKMEAHWTQAFERGQWSIRTEARTRLTANKTDWLIWGRLEAYEGETKVFEREWNDKVERKLN
jgi:predicted acyl esterase